MRHVDLSYLADTLLTVQLRPGGASYPLRNPSALESAELGELFKHAPGREQIERAHAFLQRVMPTAPVDEIQGMPYVQILKLLTAMGEAVRVVVEAAESDALPNGKAGTTPLPPIPATSPATLFTGSPPPPDAPYGPS